MQDSELHSIKFNVLDRREVIGGLSVVEISNPMNTVEFKKNKSLHDTRLGAFKNVRCDTCMGTSVTCPGHFGHVKLIWPVLNPFFTSTTLKRVITSFCFACFHETKDCGCVSETKTKNKRKRTANPTLVKLNQQDGYANQTCGNKVSFEFVASGEPITIKEMYDLIANIPREVFARWDSTLANYTDLTDTCFIHNLPVLPTGCRVPNYSGGWKMQHISRLYIEVIRKNVQLRMKIGVVHGKLTDEYHNELQSAVNILFDTTNTRKKLQQHIIQNGGIRQRIDGKQGRIRQNLMGKRTEFSARSVLSGDPKLGMNEVGIPPTVADNLTVPVKVNKYNRHKMREYKVRYISKPNGDRFDMSRTRAFTPIIEIGDTVERSLIDGDVVIVNRQPTLHRGSMIGCYVKIINTSTFRLNYSSLTTLNGDCDGDEVNLHVPQDLESRAEIEELMLSSSNIVCSQDSKPLVGLIQDALLGCFLMSRDTKIHKHDMMDVLYKMDICEFDVNNQEYWKGTKIMDFVLEHMGIELDYIWIQKSNLKIVNSKVISGVFNKAALGASDNSVIHHIWLSYGHIKAAKFIHYMQLAATAYLDRTGFSVGIGDCVVDTHEPIHHKELDEYIQADFDKNGKLPDEDLLLQATGTITKLEAPLDVTPDNNSLLAMIAGGSKGSSMNFNQITRMLGQQVVGSGRVQQELNHERRTLPHFKPNCLTLESRGFIKDSFVKGLTPQAFYFHAIAGRVGVIDTACKTATTGYQQRKLVKSMERLIVENGPDDTRVVKNMTTGAVISFSYGEDDLDGTYLKRIAEADT